jgi:hypothetical protein
MKLKVSGGSVPAGAYTAKFIGIESIPADPNRGFGEGVRWQFEVLTGPHQGARTSRITTATPTLKNACGKMLQSVSGKSLASGDEIDVATFVGRNYLVVIVATESGATRVETVSAPPM